jgi:hypothetical protein
MASERNVFTDRRKKMDVYELESCKENHRMFKERAQALAQKFTKEPNEVSKEELDALQRPYDRIIAFCNKYPTSDAAELKGQISRALSIVYEYVPGRMKESDKSESASSGG